MAKALLIVVFFMAVVVPGGRDAISAQSAPTEADLARASGSRNVALGSASTGRRLGNVPLEVYVARVLAGEGEPNAPDAAREALAVAIRTFAIVNAGRHGRNGFDVCDTTHCQVLRAANANSRRAALATAGQILTRGGVPVEVFYSASCGGRSEDASQIWSGADLPYLRSVEDDVHDDDVPWTLELTLREVRRALARVGFEGERLTDLRIEARTESGRVARLALAGLRPAVMAGEPFRAAIGATKLRSTAFSVTLLGTAVRFTGRGYGHGVGMCVIGAGRRARRGESMAAIFAHYYPGLALAMLGAVPTSEHPQPTPLVTGGPAVTPSAAPPALLRAGPSTELRAGAVTVRVAAGSTISASDLERVTLRAYESLSKALGASTASITVDLHASLDSFRAATSKPWWVSAAVNGRAIDLAPAALLAQREGLEPTVRAAIAELLVSPALADRAAWVRVGAARYFSRLTPPVATAARVRCPSDAELFLAISATAQRDADSRAETCFANAFVQVKDWRSIRAAGAR